MTNIFKRTSMKIITASIFAVLFSCIMLLAPGKAYAAISEHILRPYHLMNGKEYYKDAEKTFSMMNSTFTNGITKTSYSEMTACFNLDKKVSTVTFTVGHLDNGDTPNAELKIYLDDEYQSSSMQLTNTMMNQKVTLDTSNKKKLVLVITGSNGDYGIANIVQTSVHDYESQVTKIATVKEDGIRKYTCSQCGDSYTEKIPARKNCEPYLFPYQVNYLTQVDEEEGSSTYFEVMGNKYYKGLKKTVYSAGTAVYNLGQAYKSVTFTVGHIDGGDYPEATLKYYVDGVEVSAVPLNVTMTDKVIKVDNLSSATQLKIEISGSNGDYAVFNMTGEKRDTTPKQHSFQDEVTLEASLGMTGIMTHTCTECKAFYTSIIPALTYSLTDDSANVTLNKDSFAYNGKKRKPDVTVTYGGTTLTKNTDFTVSYSNNVNAGTATVTVKGKGNYSGSVKKKYTITKAKQPLTVKGKTITVKYSKVKKAKQNISQAKAFTISNNQGKVTFEKIDAGSSAKLTVGKGGKITLKKKAAKGTYKIKVKVTAAGNKNYKKGSKKATVKIIVK